MSIHFGIEDGGDILDCLTHPSLPSSRTWLRRSLDGGKSELGVRLSRPEGPWLPTKTLPTGVLMCPWSSGPHSFRMVASSTRKPNEVHQVRLPKPWNVCLQSQGQWHGEFRFWYQVPDFHTCLNTAKTVDLTSSPPCDTLMQVPIPSGNSHPYPSGKASGAPLGAYTDLASTRQRMGRSSSTIRVSCWIASLPPRPRREKKANRTNGHKSASSSYPSRSSSRLDLLDERSQQCYRAQRSPGSLLQDR